MADRRERLIWDALANTTMAESAFKRLARNVQGTDDDLKALARHLDELDRKSAEARVALKGDKEAIAQLDRLDLKMKMVGDKVMDPNVKIEGVARAAADLATLDVAFDKMSKKASDAAGQSGIGKVVSAIGAGATSTAGAGAGGGIGGLIGAGFALSPVLVTLGFGFAGLAGAAYGLYKPISNAAQATGGLQKNLKSLDPMEKHVAEGILGLGKEFDAFEKALRPGVFSIFNQGITLAGHLMKDIEPVTNATGKAFGGFLGSLDKMFQGSEWKNFFQFMAKTAAPDMKALGGLFIDLMKDIPPLVQDFQPLAMVILKVADDAAKLVGWMARAHLAVPALAGVIGFMVGGPLGAEIGVLAGGLFEAGLALDKAGAFAAKAKPQFSNYGGTFQEITPEVARFGTSVGRVVEPITNLSQAQYKLQQSEVAAQKAIQAAHPGAVTYGRDLSNNATHADAVAKATFQMKLQQEGASGASRDLSNNAVTAARRTETFSGKVHNLSDTAQIAARNLNDVYTQVTNIHSAEDKSLNTLTSYNDALINQYNSAATLNQDLQKSHDRIGLNTQAQRNSFGAADTYIQNTTAAAKAAHGNWGQIDNVIASLKKELPRLEDVKGGTKQYWQEVRTLVGWLHTLERERTIHEQITVTGKGQWAISGPSGSRGLQNQFPGPRAARGAYVTAGTTSTADDVLARVSKGELIVPTRYVAAGAVDHLRGRIPGFATGGVVGSYAGNVPGLPGWINKENKATVNAIASAVASAVHSGMTSAMSGGFAATPGGGAPAANAALARRMYPPWGSGAEWAAWNSVAMRESGWSQFARNASSGAYGIPQALPPSKMGPAANPPTSNPGAQIAWMISYIKSVYGDPLRAWAHELSAGWYDHGGYLPVGASIAVNTTGKPEPVGGARGPLVNVQGDLVVQDATDATIVAKKLSFAITSAGFG